MQEVRVQEHFSSLYTRDSMARRVVDRPRLLRSPSRSKPVGARRDSGSGLRSAAVVAVVVAVLCGAGCCRAETDFSILEEAQVLADQMKRLSSQELGVFTMQRIFGSFVYTEKTSNGETEVQQ
ncbi:hypothetical protein NHX12_034033, partial [Muraenolepis orangiensis]